MTHDDELGTRSRGGRPQREPLTLKGGGLGGALPMVIAAGFAGLFLVGMIAAIINGKLLWLTIPLAIIFALACLTFLASVRRSAIPYGAVIDDQGIHTTLRGARTASFPWDSIDAAGLSYEMLDSGEREMRRPHNHKLEIFSSTPKFETSTEGPEVGRPQRIDDDESSAYGVAGGRVRIDFGAAYPSKREMIKKAIAELGGGCLIDDFRRPSYRQRDVR